MPHTAGISQCEHMTKREQISAATGIMDCKTKVPKLEKKSYTTLEGVMFDMKYIYILRIGETAKPEKSVTAMSEDPSSIPRIHTW